MSVHKLQETKAVVTVAEMARMVGLSRARFYQLMGTAFPAPVYDVRSRRPIYVEELQKVCLEVRRRNCGIDGRPILFYSKGGGAPTKPNLNKIKKTKTTRKGEYSGLLDAVRALGLNSATHDQIEMVVNEAYPNGVDGVSESELIRDVFVLLKRRNTADNVGR